MDLIHPPKGASLAVTTVIAMIFLLHPEGFFWTAVDAIAQLVLGGTRVIARIPLLLRENKIVAILLILWLFALLAIQTFKEARTAPLEARSPHVRKMKRKRPGRRLSGGGHESSRSGGRTSPSKTLDKSVGEDEEDDNDTSLQDLDVPSSAVPYQVEKQAVTPGKKGRGGDRGGGGASVDTASISSSEGSIGSSGGGRSSRSGKWSSGGSGSSSSRAKTPPPPPGPPPSATPPSSSPSYGSSGPAVNKGGPAGLPWKHASPPQGNMSMSTGSSSKRGESQTSRSARPNRPFSEDFHHQQQHQHHKKRLGSSMPQSMAAGGRAAAAKPAARGVQSPYSSGAAGSLSPTPTSSAWSSGSPVSTRLSSPHGPQHQARSPFSSPQQRPQQQQQQQALAAGAVWQGERKAWGSPIASNPRSTTTLPLDSPPGFRIPHQHQQLPPPAPQLQQQPQYQQRLSQVSQRPAATIAPPPGFLSVKAEPFQPSGRVLTPTNSNTLAASPVQQQQAWASYGPVCQPQTSNDIEDSRLEMSMYALSQSVSMSVLGGDL